MHQHALSRLQRAVGDHGVVHGGERERRQWLAGNGYRIVGEELHGDTARIGATLRAAAMVDIGYEDTHPSPDRIGGLKIIVNQVMYPGVPDRAACRFVIRAVNNGSATVSAYTLLRTLDGEKSELNTWMVPTGSLAPGQSSERLYSCKNARYLVIDQQTLEGWPGRCMVNGEERSPCPLTLTLEANLNIVAK